jgi:hypothetical protein
VVGYNGHEPTWELQASVNRDLQRISECGQHYPHDYGGNWLENRLNYGIYGSLVRPDRICYLDGYLG